MNVCDYCGKCIENEKKQSFLLAHPSDKDYFTYRLTSNSLIAVHLLSANMKDVKMPDSPSAMLAELINEENILVDLGNEDRTSVVKALVENMVATDLVSKANTSDVSRLLGEREELGSTAIGGGVAIPHARIGFSDEPLMAFALLENGGGFNSLDGAPVKFVFMVLTPKDDEEVHRNVLRAITYFVKQPIHLKALSGCKSPAEVKSVFLDYA